MVRQNFFGSFSDKIDRFWNKSATYIPSAEELWRDNDLPRQILLGIASVATVVVLLLCALHVYYTIRYTSQESIRSNFYFMIFMCPVTSMAALIGMFIPRSADFLYTVNLSYYMLCLFMIVKLMFTMFGSRKALVRYLSIKQKKVKLAVPPYFQWMKCLPEFEGTHRNLLWVESLILQTVIVRILLQVTDLVVFFELKHRNHKFFTASHLIGLASMFIAFYFVYVVIDLGKERLAPYKYAILFRLNDTAQTLSSMQKFVIDVLVAYDWIPPTSVMSSNTVGVYYLNFALCLEMLILSLIATYVFHPSKTLLFDQYVDPRRDSAFLKGMQKANIVEIPRSIEQERFLDEFDPTVQPQPSALSPLPGSPVVEARPVSSPSTADATKKVAKKEQRVAKEQAAPSVVSPIGESAIPSSSIPNVAKKDAKVLERVEAPHSLAETAPGTSSGTPVGGTKRERRGGNGEEGLDITQSSSDMARKLKISQNHGSPRGKDQKSS